MKENCAEHRFQIKPVLLLSILLLLGVSIYARVWDLSWHFTNVDDIGIPEHILTNYEQNNPFIVPTLNTNAPLQFVFTHFLINPAQSYREVLFWSRLPSCVAGILGLFGLILFYFKYDKLKSFQVCIALMVFGFSWENIAFAKQASDYAAGCSAVVFLCCLFLICAEKIPSLKKLIAMAVCLALANAAQYSTFVFVPAVYLVLYLRALRLTHRPIRPGISSERFPLKDCGNDHSGTVTAKVVEPMPGTFTITARFLVSGLVYLVCVFPIWHYFLQYRLGKGTPDYAAGLNQEFLFSTDGAVSFAERTAYFIGFYLKNFFVVFQTRLGFAPEGSGVYYFLSVLFFILFILGAISFFTRKKEIAKWVGIFFGVSFFIWFELIYFQKLTLSPTRHTLFFLPILAITIAEGFGFLTDKISGDKRPALKEILPVLFVLGCSAVFLGNYGKFLETRRDPIVEEEIVAVLKKYNVSEILIDKRSIGIRFMKKLREHREAMKQYEGDRYETLARITRFPTDFTWQGCEEDRARYNRQLRKSGYEDIASHPCQDYELVYKREFDSGAYAEFSRQCGIDILRNRFYLYVVRLKASGTEEGERVQSKE